MRKIKNPFVNKQNYDCFGCSPTNPIGLHMEFFEEGDEVVSFWRPQEHYQGWVGVMHGGILATLIDEIAGWVVMRKLQTSGVTSRLNVRYLKPVMVEDEQITLRAKIMDRKRNYISIAVAIENAHGEKCVDGEAVYCAFDKEGALKMGFTGCEADDEQLLPM